MEARWSNVHVLMMSAITAALNAKLPQGLEARPEEEIRVEAVAGERLQSYRADVAVVDPDSTPVSTHSTTLLRKPLEIVYRHAPMTLRNVQIVDQADGGRVVTVIEVLSPWNKLAGRLNRKYVSKLHDLETAGTNWVEVDLLRSTRDHLPVTWEDLPQNERADYLIVTFRADDEKVSAYPIWLRDPLPIVEIPLRGAGENVTLEMQKVLTRIYTEGRFGSIDYLKPPVPPLSPQNAAWVADLVKVYH